MDIKKALFDSRDCKYRDFHSSLMPTVERSTVIGVRTPELRRIAAELRDTEEADRFLLQLPHDYYEENCLHGLLISDMKDFDRCINALDSFLVYVDNWAACDIIKPRVFAKNTARLLPEIKRLLASEHTYTVRFAINMLMSFYLDAEFSPEYLTLAAEVHSHEYYINMMRAWFFATALSKQYTDAVEYITHHRLDTWTHNKTIQKAIESRRIPEEAKVFLRSLRIKA